MAADPKAEPSRAQKRARKNDRRYLSTGSPDRGRDYVKEASPGLRHLLDRFFKSTTDPNHRRAKQNEFIRNSIRLSSFVNQLTGALVASIERAVGRFRPRSFTGWVATSALKRRLLWTIILIIVSVPAFLGFGGQGLPWGILLALALVVVDLSLVWYRRNSGRYGDNDLEFTEAVRRVIEANEGGDGPSGFDRVFEPAKQEDDAFEGVPAGVRA